MLELRNVSYTVTDNGKKEGCCRKTFRRRTGGNEKQVGKANDHVKGDICR